MFVRAAPAPPRPTFFRGILLRWQSLARPWETIYSRCLSVDAAPPSILEGDGQDAVMHSLCGRAPDRNQPLCNNAHATIPQRRLFRCEATTTAQYSLAFLTLLLLAVPVLVDHDCLAATLAYDWCSSLQGWRRRGGKPSASLLPHSEILVPEQLVTTTRNPAMASVPLLATNSRGAEVRHYPLRA